MNQLSQSVLDFWFGDLDEQELARPNAQKKWWISTVEFDQQIKLQFGRLNQQLLAGQLMDWTNSPDSTVAYIIVLDQFCRNLYRGTASAFAGDELALTAALKQVSSAGNLPVSHRFFLYMPLMHSENIEIHQQLLAKLDDEIAEASSSGVKSFWEAGKSSALEHNQIIKKYSRYPHRNSVLNRKSSAEEIDYLSDNASRFGQ